MADKYDNRIWSQNTQVLNLDENFDDDLAISPSIHQSVNYAIKDEQHYEEIDVPLGDKFYSRRGNPTSSRLSKIIAGLEGGETGMMFASGMAAISTTMMTFLKAGDHVVAQNCHYIGIGEMIDKILPAQGVTSTRVDQTSVEAFEQAIRPNTKLIILETPVNPLMHITDFKAVCELAKSYGILTFCDNTFATPLNQRPMDFGVDIVMHSATKYIGGHHDLLSGSVTASAEIMEKIWDLSMTLGSVAAPFNSWLALRGIRTLGLRIAQHNKNAMAIAEYLEQHAAVEKVYYPGLKNHPQHKLAKSQMSGYGGLLTFDLKGGYDAGQSFIKNLNLARNASSLGGVSSTVIQPAALFGGRLPQEVVEKQGITMGMIRFATGIETTDDLINDIDQAL
ncbi:MAG: aminotransferase class I/II-fold pyridoxal phosphate-dependent enzyme [Emcibacteraceae bacterium]|nr:aminotransferase class I/II-fold pyridoxal phosphate-dependent enzyme [Emcibacteraceae bacterium]